MTFRFAILCAWIASVPTATSYAGEKTPWHTSTLLDTSIAEPVGFGVIGLNLASVPEGKIGVVEFVSAVCMTDFSVQLSGIDVSVYLPNAVLADIEIPGRRVEFSRHPLKVKVRKESIVRHYVASHRITLRVPSGGPWQESLSASINWSRVRASPPSPLQCRFSISGYLESAHHAEK